MLTMSLVILSACGGGGSGGGSSGAAVLDSGCTGVLCSVDASKNYTGSGVGVWKYDNTAITDISLDIQIGGVSAGKQVTMVFSNGANSATVSTPNLGVQTDSRPERFASLGDMPIRLDSTAKSSAWHDHQHEQRLRNNSALQAGLVRKSSSQVRADMMQASAPNFAPPAVGTAKSWNDNDAPNSVVRTYGTNLFSNCPVTSGRNLLFWLDPAVTSLLGGSTAKVQNLHNLFCGTNGGYERVVALLGDVWGTHSYSNLISDSPIKQDVNIVVVNASAASWAGYFYSLNNFTNYSNSNKALVFFIDGSLLVNQEQAIGSTLLHELTHMVNYYQRMIKASRSYEHATWLEETSAMMTEDIVGPSVLSGYNKILSSRMPSYVRSAAGNSLTDWASVSSSYDLGGSFGAFLLRRFGLGIYTDVANCATPSSNSDAAQVSASYQCLDNIILNRGGLGYVQEFANFGASIFSRMTPAQSPTGYGYKSMVSNGYTLNSADPSTWTIGTSSFNATMLSSSQLYRVDTIPSGATTYTRRGVVVPANTQLRVVVN